MIALAVYSSLRTWGATVHGSYGTPEAGRYGVRTVRGASGQAALSLRCVQHAGTRSPYVTVRRPRDVRVNTAADSAAREYTYQPLALAQLRVLADARGVGGLRHVHALSQNELEDARRHLEGARQPQVVARAVVGGDEAAVVVTATHLG